MKNKILAIISILLLFTACNTKKTEQTQSLYSYIDETNGTTLMSEVASGEKLPTYIHYFVANSGWRSCESLFRNDRLLCE